MRARGGGAPGLPAEGRWHEQAPEQVRVSIAGVTPAGCPEAGELDGDFILHAVERGPRCCRWELAFPARCGLFRTVLEGVPSVGGRIGLRAFLEGSVAGPQWRGEVRDFRESLNLTFDRAAAANPSAGCLWPEAVALTALWGAAPPKSYYISPEASAAELAAMQAGGTGTGESCLLTGIEPQGAILCIGANQQFTAEGTGLDHVEWSTTPSGTPATGTGQTFITRWSETGVKTVQATCEGIIEQATVLVVAIEKIIVEGSDPEDDGPVEVMLGFSVNLRAKRLPPPADGPWPSGHPKWSITERPSPFASGWIAPQTGGTATFIASEEGTWKVKAECGDSQDELEVEVLAGCPWVNDVTADQGYKRVQDEGPFAVAPMQVVGIKGAENAVVTLTIELAAGGDPAKVSWQGATQDPNNPLKASVPIDQSILKRVIVKYDDEDCREILVWPIWATVDIRIAGNISPNNKAAVLVDGGWPIIFGGGTSLGPIDIHSAPTLTYAYTVGRTEAKATLSPSGIEDLVPHGDWRMRRTIPKARAWDNAGKYVGEVWTDQPSSKIDPEDDRDDTSEDDSMDLDPRGTGHLFDLDAPGCSTVRGTEIRHNSEVYVNFNAYVTWLNEKCSDDTPWSYRARVNLDAPGDKVELHELQTVHIEIPEDPHYTKQD